METLFLIVLAFPASFAAIWCFTVWLIARFGWATLASHHAHDGQKPNQRLSWQAGMVNSARYKGMLEVGWDSQAFYLDTTLLFRPGHRPLRIPFSSIVSRRRTHERRMGPSEELVVRAGDATVRVMLMEKTVASFAAQLPPFDSTAAGQPVERGQTVAPR